jgi:hypothetical protein
VIDGRARRLLVTPGRVRSGRRDDAVRRTIAAGLALTTLVAAVHMTLQLVDFGVYDLRVKALDASTDTTLLGVVPSVALGCAALAAIAAALRIRRRALALLAALLCLELALQRFVLHGGNAGLAATLPLVAAILVLLVREAWRLPEPCGRCVLLGGALLVTSFVLHVLLPPLLSAVGYGAGTWPYEIKVALKHGFEIAGWLTVATGLAAAARRPDA